MPKKADYQTESRRKRAPTSAQTNLNPGKLSRQMQARSQKPVPSTQPVDSSVQSAETTASVPAAAEENKGIGSAEATAPIALEASPTPKNEPGTREQHPVKSAVPLPTPSLAPS